MIKLEKNFNEQIEKENQNIFEVLEKKHKKTKIKVNEYQKKFLYETKIGQF